MFGPDGSAEEGHDLEDLEDDEVRFPFRELTAEDLVASAQVIHEFRCRLDAQEAELLQEVERRQWSGMSQYRDAAAWLRQATGVARSTARTRVEVARELLALPGAHAELGYGGIGFDHARVLAEAANSVNRDQVHEDQVHLTTLAVKQSADEFRASVAEWARDLDEQRDAGMSVHERQRNKRRVRRYRTRDGMRRTIVDLDDEADAIAFGAWRDAAAEMSRADRQANLPLEQQRSYAQLLADGVVEVAHRSRGADVTSKRRARPTILAITDLDTLWDQLRINGVCELEDGTPLTAAQLRRLACEADIIPIVFDHNSVPLDMGRSVRLATDPQRLALRAMHETCAMEGCDVPFAWCEIHHLQPWEHHGPTDLANLAPLCSYHHHWIHNLGYDKPDSPIQRLPDGRLRLTRLPLGITPRRRLRRHRPPDRVPTRA